VIKSTVIQYTKPSEYPFLGISRLTDIIVYFYKYGCGIIIDSQDPDQPIGSHSDEWLLDKFEKYEGKITLENIS